ncbi:MAG: hypothetical protein ABEI99_02995 [Halobaculum sp.]
MVVNKELSHFDYVRLEDDVIFSVCGDTHPEGYLYGYPSYRPSEAGEREYRGVSYEKFPRSLSYGLDADYYERAETDHTLVKFPAELVAEVVRGYRRPELAALDEDRRRIVTYFADRLDALDAEWYLTGSRLFDFETDDSDVDFFLVADDERVFAEFFAALAEEAEPLPTETEEWVMDNYTIQYVAARPIVSYHVESFTDRFYTTAQFPDLDVDGDIRLSFIPSHVPGTWTDYSLPDGPGESVHDIRGTVVDTSRAYACPRCYRVRLDDKRVDGTPVVDLLTSHWMYDGSFDGGERVAITGDYFPADRTVYVRDYGHYVAPTAVVDG